MSAHFNVILTFGLILIFGYIAGKVANLFKLPKITGYITAGILLEPSFLGILPEKFIENSNTISNFALCIITYAIGGSLCFSRIREQGKSIVLITLLEAELAFLLVFAGLFFGLPLISRYTGISIQPALYLPLALMAGALASPTDPTATLAVKEEYKSAGPVTNTILGVGASDDALGIINFSIATAVSVVILGGTGLNVRTAILHPLAVILFSILTGAAFALFLLAAARKVEDRGVLIVLILGSLFACFGTAQFLNLEELLATMVLGCVVVNVAKDEEKFFISIRDYFEEMIFVIFFVLAGAHLRVEVLKDSLWIVLAFVILRTLGKFIGAFTGSVISGAEVNVRKYAAFGLIPEGGIVVGLALLIRQDPRFSGISALLLNLILGTTVFHEFIGPLFAEMAIKRSGEDGKA